METRPEGRSWNKIENGAAAPAVRVGRRVRGTARHVAVVSARDHWRWEMAGISEAAHRGVAIGADDEMRDGGMRDREAQPSLWRQLQGSAHDVSYHVRVADDDLGSVTHLGGRRPRAQLSIRALDALTVELIIGVVRGRRRADHWLREARAALV